jgi:hypothetical protein
MSKLKRKLDFSHIKLSDNDRSNLCNSKSLLEIDKKNYEKMLLAIDAENFVCKGLLSSHEEHFLLLGGAIMYQIMTNPEFLNDCKPNNIL